MGGGLLAMNGPERKANAPVEATQQLSALDVLEVVETLQAKTGPAPRRPVPSNSSIAPVGLDLMPERAGADEEVNPTMSVRLPVRRRRLGAIVLGAVLGCGLILIAAGIARVGHASSGPAAAAATPPATTTAAATTPAQPAATPAAAAATETSSVTPPAAPSTGTVRLDRPAVAGHVWLDGKKLSSPSAMISCGTHQIKVGHGRTHSIDVPCGGEVGVAR
jgi:hypothetical protein